MFCTELAVFTKEYSKKLYRVDAYFLSKTLVEVPVFIIIPLIFIGITYFWIGLNPGFKHFFTAALIIILVTNAAVSFGKIKIKNEYTFKTIYLQYFFLNL